MKKIELKWLAAFGALADVSLLAFAVVKHSWWDVAYYLLMLGLILTFFKAYKKRPD